MAPVEHHVLGECEIYIRLTWPIHDPGSAVPKPGSDAIGADYGWSRETGGIEIAAQLRLHRSSLDQFVF